MSEHKWINVEGRGAICERCDALFWFSDPDSCSRRSASVSAAVTP